jgi:hypothetical protein
VDEYGTRHTFDRMFPPIPGKKHERPAADPERQRSSDPDAAGNPDPLGEPVDTVVVSGTRPRGVVADFPVQLVPFRDRGYELAPDLGDSARPNPSRNRRPRLTVNPSFNPSPVGSPNVLQQPFANPGVGPVPKPTPAPSPAPSPRPSPSPAPRPSPSPSPIGAPSLNPSAPGQPLGLSAPGQPGQLPLEHRCSCRTYDPNKKPKKKKTLPEHAFRAELEAEYKTKFGSVKIEGEAKKYCIKAKGQRRICYSPDMGLKLPGARRTPSVGSATGKLINSIIRLAKRRR